jgi:arabinose-5-phosphate isomerase
MTTPGIDVLARAREVIRGDRAALEAVESNLGEGFLRALDVLLHVQGKVLVTGMGTSGATARRIAHLLSCGGTPSLFIHPADGLHGGLGAVTSDDVVIAVSKGGESDELNDFCRLALERGSTVVAMTAVPESTLGRLGQAVLPVVTPDEADPGGMMAMGSALAACAVGDALAVVLMESRGYEWHRFERTHPGGAVGKLIEQRG